MGDETTDAILEWVSRYGYLAIFFTLILGIVGFPAPEETLLAFSGFLSSRGDLLLIPTILAGIAGSLCGITTSYLLGLTAGRWVVKKIGRYVGITPERLQRVHDWYGRFGRWTLTFGYFVPGARHLTAFVAGITRLEYRPFALYAYPGGVLWSTTYTLLGYFLGQRWSEMTDGARRIILISAGAVLGAIFLGFALHLFWVWLRERRRARQETREER